MNTTNTQSGQDMQRADSLAALLERVTPGEWELLPNGVSIIAPTGALAMALLGQMPGAQNANARLIALAPQLAASLLETVAALEGAKRSLDVAFDAEGDTFGLHHNEATDNLIAVERALANARKITEGGAG